MKPRSTLQILLVALAIPILAGSSAQARNVTPLSRSDADSSVAVRFIACYLLTVSSKDSYQLRLTLRRAGANWVAQAYGRGARSTADDSWSWAPIDATSFRIQWGGSDGAMEFPVTRRGSALEASGIMYQSVTPRRRIPFDARVRRLTCPPLLI